jgi:hypothetical protein
MVKAIFDKFRTKTPQQIKKEKMKPVVAKKTLQQKFDDMSEAQKKQALEDMSKVAKVLTQESGLHALKENDKLNRKQQKTRHTLESRRRWAEVKRAGDKLLNTTIAQYDDYASAMMTLFNEILTIGRARSHAQNFLGWAIDSLRDPSDSALGELADFLVFGDSGLIFRPRLDKKKEQDTVFANFGLNDEGEFELDLEYGCGDEKHKASQDQHFKFIHLFQRFLVQENCVFNEDSQVIDKNNNNTPLTADEFKNRFSSEKFHNFLSQCGVNSPIKAVHR